MTALSQLQADVAAERTATTSVIALVAGLSAQLKAAIASAPTDDSAALNALSTELESQTAALSAAVVANTPSAAEATTTTDAAGNPLPAPVIPPTDAPQPVTAAPSVATPAASTAASVTPPAPAADVAAAQASAPVADSQRTDGAENGVPVGPTVVDETGTSVAAPGNPTP